MLRLTSACIRNARLVANRRAVTANRFFSAARANSNFISQTSYDNVLDYGSYKSNIYTHRLPESTAEQSPELVALHARLNLPKAYTLSTLSQALNMEQQSEGLANNFGLNTLGKSFLSYYVGEHLLVKYPRLPMPIHNQAVDALMGVELLAAIGKAWGIQPDRNSKLEKYLAQEPFFMKYGKLRYLSESSKEEVQEPGVIELTNSEINSYNRNNQASYVPLESEAYASAVRSIIGGVYTHTDEETTKEFIKNHILSRKLPIESMFQFTQPMRELVRLGEKLGFKDPLEVRLIAETGRLSSHAIFVTGVFTGNEKLGEGVGSSLAESKTRAVVNALMSYYLYSPVNLEGELKVPSDEGYKFEGIVGLGDVAI